MADTHSSVLRRRHIQLRFLNYFALQENLPFCWSASFGVLLFDIPSLHYGYKVHFSSLYCGYVLAS